MGRRLGGSIASYLGWVRTTLIGLPPEPQLDLNAARQIRDWYECEVGD